MKETLYIYYRKMERTLSSASHTGLEKHWGEV